MGYRSIKKDQILSFKMQTKSYKNICKKTLREKTSLGSSVATLV